MYIYIYIYSQPQFILRMDNILQQLVATGNLIQRFNAVKCVGKLDKASAGAGFDFLHPRSMVVSFSKSTWTLPNRGWKISFN